MKKASTFEAVFLRSYSRRNPDQSRETWEQCIDRSFGGLADMARYTPEQYKSVQSHTLSGTVMMSGRWMWVGGTEWVTKPENFLGSYNCSSMVLDEPYVFSKMMSMAMQGTGTGAVVELDKIRALPPIKQLINVTSRGEYGFGFGEPHDETRYTTNGDVITMTVGDSREGWCAAVQFIIDLAMELTPFWQSTVIVDVSNVRSKGKKLKGFGGVSNPSTLKQLFPRLAEILNGAFNRDYRLNSVECCLISDECANVVVAGNIRRCLPENSLISTSKGLVPIKNVHVGDMVQTPEGFRRVSNKFDQGVQNVYDLDTNGPFAQATINHKYAVMAGLNSDDNAKIEWKRVGDLTDNDRLFMNRQVLPGSRTSLPQDFTQNRSKHSTTCATVQIPELDSEIAWFIGYTHGNGCIQLIDKGAGKVNSLISWSFNRNYDDMGDRIADRIIANVKRFGIVAKRKETKGENTSVVSCSSVRLAEYMQRFVKKPTEPLSIPDYILEGSSDIRAAYMAGLFDSDGAQNNRPVIAVTSIYLPFCRQVTALLASLGIPSRVNITRDANHLEWNAKYNITLPGLKHLFNDRVALYSCKGKITVNAQETRSFSIPASMVRAEYNSSEMIKMGANGSLSTLHKTNVSFAKFVDYTESAMDIPITFKSLTTVDVIQTWDIEVEGEHCFYADGYLVHNSAAIKQGSVEDLVFATAKDNLWIETDGVWSVDAKRAAHRMSNHTRVFHHKPNFDEVKEAVTKQFNSGEGAIMYAPEAIARCNADLLPTNRSRYNFIAEYEGGQGGQFLTGVNPDMDQREIDHRLNRYGFNPCFAAGTMVMTRAGHFPIETLVGKVVEVWDGNEWVEIDNFRITGENQPVYVLEMGVGESITATGTHRFILENGESRLLKELVPGDRLMLTKLVIKAIYKKSVSADVKSVTKLSEIADKVYCCTVPTNNRFTLSNGLVVGNCAEILGKDFMCNLAEVHLNLIDFADYKGQISAFKVASLIVAPLLKHVFQDERQRYSRTIDPIVGVSFTGLFDFFAKGFGLSWLEWWQAGRPNRFNRYAEGIDILKAMPEDWLMRWDKDHDECDIAIVFRFVEKQYLEMWRIAAESQVAEYCNEQGLRRPNRCTTVQPAGSKSLLTGASCGWHPPKAMNYIRRITFAKNDPVALTLIDRGFSVVPGQNDRDESGALLNDPFSPLCTEWLVEMPTQAIAGSVPGAENIDPNMFSAVAQFDFYMQVQKFYTRHNTSATIELREDEIGALSSAIHMAIDDGYISAALLPRYDAPFPRLPFEAIAKGKYEELMKEVNDRAIISEDEFMTQLRKYDSGEIQIEGPAGCDSDKCLSSDTKTR